MTSLEALEHLNKNIIVAEDIDEDFEIIEKELKALNEILALHDKWLGNHQISDFEFFTLLIEIRDKYGLLKEAGL